jgi:hypothetical protein
MAGFLAAHGYEPGPTQRPLTAGALSGIAATIPAVALLFLFGSVEVEARILGFTVPWTIGLGCGVMAAAGAVYSRLFGRAANDTSGGWLFGMMFGFVLWAAGAVLVLPLVSGGTAPGGVAAIGVVLALLAWGATLGAIHPFVHRRLHQGIEQGAQRSEIGPSAATRSSAHLPR